MSGRTSTRASTRTGAPGSAGAGAGAGAEALALVRATHPGPALAVTVLAAALALATEMPPSRVVLVTAAVLAGQLSVGWCNDLVDAARDRQVGRSDKPLATGELRTGLVRGACVAAVLACVGLSLACGAVPGLVHLGCVAAAWAYNLRLKATAWSWLPYALAFGGLTVFVSLAAPTHQLPAAWVPVSAALLGVGAHLVNALPDLADDEATGIRGLPHRIGARWTPVVAVTVLVTASVVIALSTAAVPGVLLAGAAVTVTALAVTALVGRGRGPFAAAVGIALVDVVLLVAAR
ncbi:UbiA family prenyltransferase [Nocardioides houyundeii]|uniref:UbiA family prenyltransferase n=1 Tax=Nocardioides houyundeii TaxID=2045452 RepID=UPI0018F01F4D|nr:UbiA family prenyltransferase [Nocardioides houyundeii]